MRIRRGIASLAIGLALAGCGASPLAVRAAAPGAMPPTGDAPAAEAQRPLSMVHAKMIKGMFAHLEKKFPAAQARLHDLEQQLLGLSRPQMLALKALRYQARKDKTLEEVRKQAEGLLGDPDALIADITKDLAKVKSMSAQEMQATSAEFPAIFKELMEAMENAAEVAGHEEEATPMKAGEPEEARPEEARREEGRPAEGKLPEAAREEKPAEAKPAG